MLRAIPPAWPDLKNVLYHFSRDNENPPQVFARSLLQLRTSNLCVCMRAFTHFDKVLIGLLGV